MSAPGPATHRVVVSSDNSLYMAWQTQLFCYSAWTAFGQRPVIVVHDTTDPLRPEFQRLAEQGHRVLHVPSAARTPRGLWYPPRNELWSLHAVAQLDDLDADCILFCESDMLFARPRQLPRRLAAEFYGYLHYQAPRVAAVAGKYRLGDRLDALDATRRIGVPYVIPVRDLKRLAARWIEVLDAFDELEWIDIMYAFGIALEIEGDDVEVMHAMTDNYRATRPVRGLIHYCYGDESWDKRAFRDRSPFDLPDHALPRGVRGTVLGEIMRQIREAKAIYGPAACVAAGGAS